MPFRTSKPESEFEAQPENAMVTVKKIFTGEKRQPLRERVKNMRMRNGSGGKGVNSTTVLPSPIQTQIRPGTPIPSPRSSMPRTPTIDDINSMPSLPECPPAPRKRVKGKDMMVLSSNELSRLSLSDDVDVDVYLDMKANKRNYHNNTNINNNSTATNSRISVDDSVSTANEGDDGDSGNEVQFLEVGIALTHSRCTSPLRQSWGPDEFEEVEEKFDSLFRDRE